MKSKYPKGWDEKRVRMVLSHYEGQTEEEAAAEDDDAFKNRTQTAMDVPIQLVSTVRKLIAEYKSSKQSEIAADNVC
jgi:hypothetical protein